jgi:hypothetical protein
MRGHTGDVKAKNGKRSEKMRKIIWMMLWLPLLVSCDKLGEGAKNAKDETPMKYVVCSPGEKDCVLMARFKDMEACYSYKKKEEMVCTRVPGKEEMNCKKELSPIEKEAHCLS